MTTDDTARLKLAPFARRAEDRITGSAQLLYPEGAIELSETADAIVSRLDGTRSLAVIVEELAAEFDADREIIRPDVVTLITELIERGLVQGAREVR